MSIPSFRKQSPEATRRAELIDQMQFLGQMLSTETALFHHKAAAKNGLNITDSKTMSTIMQEGPMTAGQLAKRLSLTTGAVTSVIDRLENAGFAKRVFDPDDRRKVFVQINFDRLRNTSNTYDSIGRTFKKLLKTYSTTELEFLVNYYKVSVELTKKEIAKLSQKGL